MRHRDYDELLKAEFGMEIQPEAFGFSHNFSIEGSTCEYYDKVLNDARNEANVKMDFMLDYPTQDYVREIPSSKYKNISLEDFPDRSFPLFLYNGSTKIELLPDQMHLNHI